VRPGHSPTAFWVFSISMAEALIPSLTVLTLLHPPLKVFEKETLIA
jgi:hypothetical protein